MSNMCVDISNMCVYMVSIHLHTWYMHVRTPCMKCIVDIGLIHKFTKGIPQKTFDYVDYADYIDYSGYIGFRITILLYYEDLLRVGKRLTLLNTLTLMAI